MKKVVVVVPLSWDYVPTHFLLCWTKMVVDSFGRYNMSVITNRMPYLDYARDSLVKEALKDNADYVLWLDADQIYPDETVEILMNHIDSGKLIVGGVTPHRGTGQPMIYDFTDKEHVVKFRKNLGKGIIKIGGMGMGGVMVHPDVFAKLEYPYFQMKWNDETNRKAGEDVVFYQNCKNAGIDVWCDTDLRYEHIVCGIRKLRI